jgi:hypothetical protein
MPMIFYKAITILSLSLLPILNYAYSDQRTEDAVVGNTYLLYSINDVNVRSQFNELPYLHFYRDSSGNIDVSGKVCNDFKGRLFITEQLSLTSDMIANKKQCEIAVLSQFKTSIQKWFDHSMIQENNGVLTIYNNGTVVKMSQYNY